MCTLIALHRCVPGAPLVVAANRDEFSARPAEGPALRRTPHGPIVAPLDLRAGGTWLGLNAAGLFAAVTNRRCESPDPGRRSRGLLVLDALAADSADQAAERMEKLATGTYNPFTLFVADRRSAFAVTCVDSPSLLELRPGVHVIGNADPAKTTPKSERLRKKTEAAASGDAASLLDRLATICRDHDGGGDPLQDACVHAGEYGTRSSALLMLADAGAERALRFVDRAPCAAEYEDFTPLLHELDRSRRFEAGESAMRKVS
ncbi:MAG: NRDE family protein [Myxococcales bacterium]|nr:NRDE family protein [Myxococcales bacterium]